MFEIHTCEHFQVKRRTKGKNYLMGSHVQQYGDLGLNNEHLSQYMGTNDTNDNSRFIKENSFPSFSKSVNQRDVDLLHFWQKVWSNPTLNGLLDQYFVFFFQDSNK